MALGQGQRLDAQRADLEEQWKAAVSLAKSRQHRLALEAVSHFSSYNVGRSGNIERAAYFDALEAWYSRQVEKLQQNISACQLGIAGRNNDLATSSQFTAQTVLKALNGGTQTIEWIKPILVGLIGLRMK